MKERAVLVAALMVFAGAASLVWAQDEPIPYPEPGAPILSSAELDQMLEPIALYPDPLIAQILPAATQPSQIALAANYLNQGGDPNLIDEQPWDSSVKAVAHYPDVLNLLDSNLPWTAQLGQAFVDQPEDVMNSIQNLRAQAQNLGNLQSTPEEEVISDDGTIEIVPTDPGVIYVPIYDPGLVFFQYPYGRHFISYGRGFRTGGWLDHDFDWRDHHVIAWDRDHPRPSNWWHERPSQRPHDVVSRAPVWHPQTRPAVSPVGRGDRGYARPTPTRTISPQHQASTEHRGTAPGRVETRTVEPRTPTPAPHENQPRPAQHQGQVTVHQAPARPTVQERAPAPVQHAVNPPSHSTSSSAFMGAQSAHDTRAASSRGQESRQAISHPAPAPAAHPAAPSGGSGGNTRKH
ncbi:MAG TPA: DUF3300 domain-containing protein [Verrucomicrobiae bacterium]|nr:DUF3300 domain-containing protein [Verrucomicrobiae bacterium]